MQDNKHTRRRVTVLLGSGLAASFAGCAGGRAAGQDDGTTTTTTTATGGNETTTTTDSSQDGMVETTNNPCEAVAAGNAAVRIAHLSPDAPDVDVDVAVNGSTMFSGVSFGTVSPYLVLPTETTDVSVTPSDGDSPIFDGELGLEAQAYTVAALGEVADQNHPLMVKPFVDSVWAPEPGTTKVRLIHAAPDAPPVDVTVEGADVTLFDDVAFGEASEYATPEAGDYTAEIRPATEGNDGDVVTTIDASLPAGAVVTVFAVGYLSPDSAPANEPFKVIPVVDDPG